MNDEAQAKFSYPEELPISVHRDEIMSLMRRHPVVIVYGDTGSGKTTQIPKMAMELGRGAGGRLIACTQPRRLAAVTVAERVAKELGESAGGTIGYMISHYKIDDVYIITSTANGLRKDNSIKFLRKYLVG